MMIRCSILILLLSQAWGCANLDAPKETSSSEALTVVCTNSADRTDQGLVWELGVSPVSPGPIGSGSRFSAELEGTMVFDEGILDRGLEVLGSGLREVNLVDLKATVHVRAGAVGPDVTLEVEPVLYPYQCFAGRAFCDPANDLASVPGLRGNTDCEPVGDTNACGRFIEIPSSSDCAVGGICAQKRKLDQCASYRFCITGDLRVPLQSAKASYTAGTQGQVLFGWDDEKTGATLGEDGIWTLPPAVYDEPTGPNGLRLTAGLVPVAFECTMATFDTDRVPPQPVRTPDSELISFPIELLP